MKIAYIANSIIPGSSANSVHVMKMCEALKKQGVDITLVVPKSKNFKTDQEIFLYYGIQDTFPIFRVGFKKMPYGIWNLIFSFFAIIKVWNKGFDSIYTRSPIVARILSMGKMKFIFEYHGIDFSKQYSEKKIFCANNLIKFVVITDALKKYFKNSYAIQDDKIVVLPDGVNLDEYQEQDRVEILSEERMKIAYVGGLYPGRGIDIIIELARRDQLNEYLIVGGREEQVKFWKDRMKGDMDNIKFIGQIPNSEIPDILLCQDILLMPYQNQVGINGKGDTAKWMSPMKMFEYMASGRVIISSDLPVLKEILTNRRNAYLVQPDCVSEWMDTIQYISCHRNEAVMIAAQSREDVKAYSWERRAAKIKDMVTEMKGDKNA